MTKGKVEIIFALVMVSIFVFHSQVAFAQSVEEEWEMEDSVIEEEAIIDSDSPTEYTVAVLLQNVGKVDRDVGQYWVDFWIDVTAEGVDFTKDPPSFDFVNGKDLDIGDEYIEEGYWEARVQGTFFNEMDFRDYPFETIDLKVEVEPALPNDVTRVVFVIDPDSGTDSEANVPGWEMAEATIDVSEHVYDEGEPAFSRVTAVFPIERSVLGSIMVTFLPITLVAGISLIVFFIPENYTPRIYLTAPLLLSLVYLHTGALKGLPPLGYMTIFDYIAVIYYALFVNSILSLGVQMRFQTLKKHDLVVKSNRIQLYLVPIIIVAGIIAILVR